MAQAGQGPVQQGGDDGTGQDVAEVTAGHADGGGQLRDDVDGRHQEDGVEIPFQVAQNAAGLDLVVGNQDKDHHGPGQFGVQVSGGAPEAQHADEVASHAQREDGAHQGDILVEVEAHVVVDELFQPFHHKFGHRLPFGDVFQLEVVPQPERQPRQKRHHDPGHHQGLGDVEVPQNRDIGVDGKEDFCAV